MTILLRPVKWFFSSGAITQEAQTIQRDLQEIGEKISTVPEDEKAALNKSIQNIANGVRKIQKRDSFGSHLSEVCFRVIRVAVVTGVVGGLFLLVPSGDSYSSDQLLIGKPR